VPGANDGLVANLSLVTGVAVLLAGALSMAMGEWISVWSSRELYTAS
jgi:vacuolar iron transporter family protein